MKKNKLKPLCIALSMAFVGTASAATMDLSGSNIYMKFLDGNQRTTSTGSIDTNSGADQGQFTELNLVFKATISPQVEAGGRIQSRSSAAYWTEYGGFGNEGTVANDSVNHQKFMKLRGAYVELTPGYSWLNTARIGTSDWGMFDPFTMGKIRYIDRDNYNGFYFKGPLAGSWELARVSLPEYLGVNFSTGTSPKNQAIYVTQFKQSVGSVRLMEGYTYLDNQELNTTDTNPLNGTNQQDRMKNTILSLKADSAITDGLDVRAAIHHSSYSINNANVVGGIPPGDYCYTVGAGCGSTSNAYLTTGVMGYSMTPGADVNGNAIKLDFDWRPAAADGLSINYQYFNIGAGYVSVGGARRESDVLLTEGSEAAWYGWGKGNQWLGGRANDMQQAPVIQIDNGYTDFDETGAESSIGWKGHTFKFNYEIANTPMLLEATRVDYNTNWQNYGGEANIYDVGHGQGTYDVYKPNQDRSTNIMVFKLNHIFQIMGGLDTNFKYKRVDDKDGLNAAIATDDIEVNDRGYSLSVGNQLVSHVYGTLSYGKYNRDITVGGAGYNNDKSIVGLRFAYNLQGFEAGMLTQWINGNGDPSQSGVQSTFQQYRMKAFAQVNF